MLGYHNSATSDIIKRRTIQNYGRRFDETNKNMSMYNISLLNTTPFYTKQNTTFPFLDLNSSDLARDRN